MCVLTGIITALGTIGTAITGAVGGSVVGLCVALYASVSVCPVWLSS